MISQKKINNEKVQLLKLDNSKILPALGSDIFPECFSNTYVCARKKSGKTFLLAYLLKKCTGLKTKVVICCSSVHKDKAYQKIIERLEKRGNEVKLYQDIKEDPVGQNLNIGPLDDFSDEEPIEEEFIQYGSDIDSEEEEEKRTNRRTRELRKKRIKKEHKRFTVPDIIFVFDDLGQQLRDKSINFLLKRNRHWQAKVFIVGHHCNDMQPEALKQLDYCMLFSGHSLDKLKLFHKHLDLSITLEQFLALYKAATGEKYSFLYIDQTTGRFRKKLDTELSIQM